MAIDPTKLDVTGPDYMSGCDIQIELAKEARMFNRVIAFLCLTLSVHIMALASELSTSGQTDRQKPKGSEQQQAEKLLTEAGLGHLTDGDKDKVTKLLTNAVAKISSTNKRVSDIAKRAERYFEIEGYKPFYLKVVSVRGDNWLIANTGLTTSATKDLPMMFPTLLFMEGFYFCKPALMGGITEMIDDSGRKQPFMFADWKDMH